jgi:protein involved in polysaccharide export with SLBB domain
LRAGDRITVTVYGPAELSGDFPIDGAGNIRMPLVGAIPRQPDNDRGWRKLA